MIVNAETESYWLMMSSKRNDPRLSRKYKEVRLKALARDGWTCYYCGKEGQGMALIKQLICYLFKHRWLYIPYDNIHYALCDRCNKSVYLHE